MKAIFTFFGDLFRLPTQQERDDAYLADSVDIYDLECRMRRLDQARGQSFR